MKKLLLSIVPALMLLGSCSGAQPQVEKELFCEDTLAHEEIFGRAQEAVRKVRRNDPVPKDPILKTQRKNNGDGTYSIRFVAAVDLGTLSTTTVTWTRTMYDGDGNVVKKTKNLESEKVYTTLFDGEGKEYSISQAEYTGYTHFAVYTMTGIPTSGYDDYYLNAYVTIGGEGSTNIVSNVASTTVDLSKRVQFPVDQTGYFLKGSFAGKDPLLPADKTTKGGNVASFSCQLTAEDYFLIVKNEASNFQVFDSSVLKGDGNPIGEDFKDDSGLIAVRNSGYYILYLNNSKELWRRNNVDDFKLVGINSWNWADGITGIIDQNYDGNASVQMKFTFELTEYKEFKVVRYWGGDSYSWYGTTNSTVKGGAHESYESDYNIALRAGSYEVYVRVAADNAITTIIFKNSDSYYLAGSFSDWKASAENILIKNTNGDTEEYILSGKTFDSSDAFKAMNSAAGYWYPDGTGNDITGISGKKIVYFRPNGDGGEGWYYQVLYFADYPAEE